MQLAKRYIDDYKKMEKDPAYGKEIRMEPGEFAPKKDLKGKAKETEAFEGWVDSMIDEGGIKPYVSMSRGEKDGKMMYNVLDRNEKTIFASRDYEEAKDFLRLNYDKLRAGEMQVASGGVDTVDVDEYAKMGDFPRDKEIEKKDKENATKLDVTKADKMMNTPAYQKMKAGDDKYADKTKSEGNQFAQAVQKAKAAGMKAGDKFKVGDQEYTLKDAIEMAGLQLEEFFSEEEIEVPAEAQAEAEAINTELDRIKTLANLA
mgnify:CR=1 FL=1